MHTGDSVILCEFQGRFVLVDKLNACEQNSTVEYFHCRRQPPTAFVQHFSLFAWCCYLIYISKIFSHHHKQTRFHIHIQIQLLPTLTKYPLAAIKIICRMNKIGASLFGFGSHRNLDNDEGESFIQNKMLNTAAARATLELAQLPSK